MLITIETLLKLAPFVVGVIGGVLSAWLSSSIRKTAAVEKKADMLRQHYEIAIGGRRIVVEASGISDEAISKIERAAKDAIR